MISESNEHSLPRIEIEYAHPRFCYATIVIPAHYVDTIYRIAAQSQQKYVAAPGFQKGSVPISYIEENYTSSLVDHVKEFLYQYTVLEYLHQQIQLHKLVVIGEPRLQKVDVQPGHEARFTFELTLFPDLHVQEWRYYPFKAPKRKQYKDLDRQVESFMKEERDLQKTAEQIGITHGDWVHFLIELVDERGNPILKPLSSHLWLKIDDEETDESIYEPFLGKQIGEAFITDNKSFQEYFSSSLVTDYLFKITIVDIVPQSYFCFESFKKQFKLKTNKEVLQKLIEVFSYRNDLSQRRSMIEESLKLLLSKHRFTIPNHLVLRQQKHILDIIQNSPDYQVYRMQKDFEQRIKELAEKQVKEMILLNQLSIQDNVHVHDYDLRGYLTLMQRPRMKEFIYFDLPATRIAGRERPIPHEILKIICLREKTLNHIIHHLTKQ